MSTPPLDEHDSATHHHTKLKERVQVEKNVHGHPMPLTNIIRIVSLVAFFVIMGIIVWYLWPLFGDIFKPGGVDRIITDVRNAGAGGFLILLAIEFLQVVVPFIPGEVVQISAGLLYGPWVGTALIVLGCVISSAFVFLLVHKLGAPFVQAMASDKQLDKLRAFEAKGRLNILVFILFLIPGLPKDLFTYLTPLTNMRMRTFLILTNVARIPGILLSTYAANGLVEGDYTESIIIFAVTALIALVSLIVYTRLTKDPTDDIVPRS